MVALADSRNAPSFSKQEPPPVPTRLALEFVRQAPFLPSAGDPSAVSCAAASSAVRPWPHQIEVVRRAVQCYPQGFLFCDEVGLGKTVEAGLALRSLWISRSVRRALLLVPAALLRQWQEEMHEKFALEVARLDGERFFDVRGREIRPARDTDNPWNRHDLVLASSQLVRRRERAGGRTAARSSPEQRRRRFLAQPGLSPHP